jgi:hypothetical protein
MSRALANTSVSILGSRTTRVGQCNTSEKCASDYRTALRRSATHTQLMGGVLPESRTDRLLVRGPSRATAPEGFLLPEPLAHREPPGASRNGRPGSRGSREHARAQVRGACRRERGDEPDTDGRASFFESSQNAARRRQRRNIPFPVCRTCANRWSLWLVMRGLDPRIHQSGILWIQERWIAGSSPARTALRGAGARLKPTLVVKMSDTSHHGKAGSNPAFDSRTVERPGKGPHAPRRRFLSDLDRRLC